MGTINNWMAELRWWAEKIGMYNFIVRANPCARMPHSRKASNSSLMNRGNSLPVLASVCAMKLAACCCTRLYSWSAQGSGARSAPSPQRPRGALAG